MKRKKSKKNFRKLRKSLTVQQSLKGKSTFFSLRKKYLKTTMFPNFPLQELKADSETYSLIFTDEKKSFQGLFSKNHELHIQFLTRIIDPTLTKPCPLNWYGLKTQIQSLFLDFKIFVIRHGFQPKSTTVRRKYRRT